MIRRALVLGGGGITAIAWEFGLLAGLAGAGVPLDDADEVLGTSAGSVVGAQVLTHAGEELPSDHTRLEHRELGGSFALRGMLRSAPRMVGARGHLDRRRRVGRAALAALPTGGEERVELLRRHLDLTTWPERQLRVTAMNARTGRVEIFDKDSGVDIVRAIAASCAVPFVWPAVEINGTPYLDGGVRSPTNADLVREPSRTTLLALAPLQLPLARHQGVDAEIARAGFADSLVIRPDAQARKAIGHRILDPRRAEGSAAAGLAQGERMAERVRALWHRAS